MLVTTMGFLKYSLSINLSLFGTLDVKITVISYLSSMTAKIVAILLVVMVM